MYNKGIQLLILQIKSIRQRKRTWLPETKWRTVKFKDNVFYLNRTEFEYSSKQLLLCPLTIPESTEK